MLYRSTSLLLVVVLALSLAGCFFKKEDPQPDPTPGVPVGTVQGTIVPATAVTRVYLAPQGSQSGPITYPDVAGLFRFSNIEVGVYNVWFEAASGYLPPAPRLVTVTDGGTASLGTIAVSPAGPSSVALRGTVTWSAGGNSYSSGSLNGSATLWNGQLSGLQWQATAQTGALADIVGLTLPSFGGASLYRIENGTGSATATYLRTNAGVPAGSFTTSGYTGLLGTLTVTAQDPVARTLSGTFGYTAYDRNGSVALGTDRITVSNGTFSLSY